MTLGTKFTVFFIVMLMFGCIAFNWYKEILDIQAKRALGFILTVLKRAEIAPVAVIGGAKQMTLSLV